MGEIHKEGETVPAASCSGSCLVSQEASPLEPDALENKFYVSGVGLILTVDRETGVREERIEHTRVCGEAGAGEGDPIQHPSQGRPAVR